MSQSPADEIVRQSAQKSARLGVVRLGVGTRSARGVVVLARREVGGLGIDAVDILGDTRITGRLADTADRDRAVAQAVLGEGQVGDVVLQVLERIDLLLLQRVAGNRGDRDRNRLQVFSFLFGCHHDHFDLRKGRDGEGRCHEKRGEEFGRDSGTQHGEPPLLRQHLCVLIHRSMSYGRRESQKVFNVC